MSGYCSYAKHHTNLNREMNHIDQTVPHVYTYNFSSMVSELQKSLHHGVDWEDPA